MLPRSATNMGHLTLCVIGIFMLIMSPVLAGRSFQETVTVDGAYYTMSLYQDNAENMYNRNKVDMSSAEVHEFLSTHSQAAEAIEPGFGFPFYGHLAERFFVTTHGFLSFAPGLHNLMYKTQYVAPLRVKLDPGRHNDSTINYILTDNSLTIQWTNITVAEPFEHPSGGRFTFQVMTIINANVIHICPLNIIHIYQDLYVFTVNLLLLITGNPAFQWNYCICVH